MNLTDTERDKCRDFISSLVDVDQLDDTQMLTKGGHEKVAELMVEHGITHDIFYALDSYPGHWGYKRFGNSGNEGEWHFKLRQFRNRPENDLKAIFEQINP